MPLLSQHQKERLAIKSLEYIRHVQRLNITLEAVEGNRVTLRLPYQAQLIGNPDTGVLHSGVITTLMDTTCGLATLFSGEAEPTLCPTLDLRIDHLATAPAGDTIFATAAVYKVTNRIIFVQGEAFCSSLQTPVSRATANFVRLKNMDTSHLLNE